MEIISTGGFMLTSLWEFPHAPSPSLSRTHTQEQITEEWMTLAGFSLSCSLGTLNPMFWRKHTALLYPHPLSLWTALLFAQVPNQTSTPPSSWQHAVNLPSGCTMPLTLTESPNLLSPLHPYYDYLTSGICPLSFRLIQWAPDDFLGPTLQSVFHTVAEVVLPRHISDHSAGAPYSFQALGRTSKFLMISLLFLPLHLPLVPYILTFLSKVKLCLHSASLVLGE